MPFGHLEMRRRMTCLLVLLSLPATLACWSLSAGAQQAVIGSASAEVTPSNSDEREFSSSLQAFSEVLQTTSRFQRRLALFRLVANAEVRLLHELLILSLEIHAKQLREEVQQVVVLKLASVNPMTAMDLLKDFGNKERSRLTQVVFQEWSLSNLEQAVDFAKSLDRQGKVAALKGIRDSREDLTEDRWTTIVFKLSNQQVANNLMDETMAREIIENPDDALNMFLSEKGGALKEEAHVDLFEHVSRSLIQKYGIRAALRRVDQAIGSNHNRGRVLNVFFDEVRKEDPEQAVKLGVAMSEGEDELVGGGVILGWAFDDPLRALEAALSIQDVKQRSNALLAFPLSGAAEDIPEHILEVLSRYPREGTGSVLSRAVSALAIKSPEQAVRHFDRIQDEVERLELAKNVVEVWSRSDAVSALNWIKSSNDIAGIRQNLIPIAIKELVYVNFQLALDTALELVTPKPGIGPEAAVIEEIAKSDADIAFGMLHRARDEPTKLAASQAVATAFIRNGESERAIEIGNDLSDLSRDKYFHSLIGTWKWLDWHALYRSLDQFPTSEIQSAAAESLLFGQWSRNGIRLTSEQEKVVSSYLSKESLAAQDARREEYRDLDYVLFRSSR